MKTLTHMIGLAAIALMAAGVAHVQAQTISWNAGAGDWTIQSNWNPVRLPGAGDHVDINRSDADVTLDMTGNIDIASLRMYQGKLSVDTTGEYAIKMTSPGSNVGLSVGYNGNEATFTMKGDGTLDVAAHLRVGDNGTGTFNMHGGLVNVGNRLSITENGGTGTFNMYDGTVEVDNFFIVGIRPGSSGTFNMYGGTVHAKDEVLIGHTSGAGTVNMYGGSFTSAGTGGKGMIDIGAWNGLASTFNMYSGAQVHANDWIRIGRQNAGTFRAWLDGSAFTPMTAAGQLILNDQGQTAHLDVAIVGGVMLTAESSFNLINAASQSAGDWVSKPNATLWTTTTSGGNVSVELNATDGLRGTLDASIIGNKLDLTTSETVGYIGLSGVNTQNPLELRLGMFEASVGASNLDDFIGDLDAAGYSPLAIGDYAVDITLDPGLNGADYFAWDLSAYTSGPALQIQSITVVPEPGSALLALVAVAGLLLVRRTKP